MTEQPIRVTLVHGTFARKAKWIREARCMLSGRLLKVRDGSISVVTLATQLLFASSKTISRVVRALAAVAAVGALVGAPLFTSLEGLPGRRDDLEWGVVLLDIMFVAVLIQMLACLYWLTQRHGQPSRKGDRDPFITAVQTPDTGGGGLLVVSAADNEASTSLALGQLSTLVAVTAMRLSRPRPGKCA